MQAKLEALEQVCREAIKMLDGLTTQQQKSWPDRMCVLVAIGQLRVIRHTLDAIGGDAAPETACYGGQFPPSVVGARGMTRNCFKSWMVRCEGEVLLNRVRS